jgi:DNA modification methylase
MSDTLPLNKIIVGSTLDVMRTWPSDSIHCVVTSPPYWGLRDYGVDEQIGLEATPEEFVAKMVEVFREVRRVLRPDGVCWVNLGDSYNNFRSTMGPGQAVHGRDKLNGKPSPESKSRGVATLKEKDLVGIPWRVAFALQADGWYLRQDIIWHKPNPMPESVTDRCTKSHEYIFLLTKSARYYYDAEAVKEDAVGGTPGNKTHKGATAYRNGDEKMRTKVGLVNMTATAERNKRSVWTVPTKPFAGWTKTVHWVCVAEDDACDGMRRKASEDCPVHGRQGRQGGEHAASETSRSLGTDDCREPALEHGQTSSSKCHGTQHEAHSLDSPDQLCCGSATVRSTETSKTGRDLATTRPCTPSVQIESDTPRTQAERESSGQHRGTCENSISAGELGGNPSSRTTDGTADTYSESDVSLARYTSLCSDGCTCSFYRKTTTNTSHFATFPPALIEPCILAGTSAEGCCPSCGTPWERVVEKTGGRDWHNDRMKPKGIVGELSGNGGYKRGQSMEALNDTQTSTTVGWQPTCRCPRPQPRPVPCVVFDPFMGSGTVAEVARRNGCHYVGTELNPEYAKLCRKRLRQGTLLVTEAT